MTVTTSVQRRVWRHGAIRNLSLFHKVALALGLIALLVGAVLAYASHTNANHTETLHTFDREVIEPLDRAEKLRNNIAALQARLLSLSVAENQAIPSIRSSPANELAARLDRLEVDFARVMDAMPPVLPYETAPVGMAFANYAALVRKTLPMAASREPPDLPAIIEQYGRLSIGLDTVIDALDTRHGIRLRAAIDESTQAQSTLITLGIGATCLAFFGAAIAAPMIARPVHDLARQMDRLAAGDTGIGISALDRLDEVGAMARAVGVFRDNIIARREGEAILRQTNLQLDATLNSMVQGILVWGPDHRVQIVNKRYTAVVGVTEASVVPGMTVEDIVENYQSHGLHLDKSARAFGDMIRKLISGHPSTESEMVFRPDLIVRVITEPMENGGAVITYEDITERRQSQERIAFMAHHDALTGLPNRKMFQERMDALTAEQPEQDPFAVLCLDLDRFKEVNDTLGHPAGDELLRLVAARLRSCVRDGDLIARLGGDEFAIIVEGGNPPSAAALATRLIGAVGAPYQLHGNHTVIGTSIGIVMSEPSLPGSELLKRADVALYRSKEDRGTFAFFEPGMDEQLQVRRQLEADLRLAILRNEFVLHYQPLYNLAEDRITGFEALIRWNSPSRGFVAPDHFIPISEQTGLIVPIGEWVLATACADAMQWPDHVRVAVNLSALQTKSKRLLPLIQETLTMTGLPARRLELEITETVLLQDTDTVIATLNSLHAMGVRVSMDDFGTGYSSLSYLRRFQFDKLKIDRSFISDLRGTSKPGVLATGPLAAAEKSAATIVRAIVGLGENLGISTTAEGVETAEQFAQVRAKGCTEVQGYFISPPKPASQIAALLHRFEKTLPEDAERSHIEPHTAEQQVPSPLVVV